jgi:hypothetical protein
MHVCVEKLRKLFPQRSVFVEHEANDLALDRPIVPVVNLVFSPEHNFTEMFVTSKRNKQKYSFYQMIKTDSSVNTGLFS